MKVRGEAFAADASTHRAETDEGDFAHFAPFRTAGETVREFLDVVIRLVRPQCRTSAIRHVA